MSELLPRWLPYNTLLVVAGASLLGASAGAVGVFGVLRRRALTGDALAHAALPGVCLAFILLGDRNLAAMLAGALATGVLGIVAITLLRRWTRVKEDAAIGTVLSVFFGLGVVLMKLIERLPSSGKAGVNAYILGKTAGMSLEDVYVIGGLALGVLLALLLLYKEFKLVAFDPAFAQVQGWPVVRLDLLLLLLIAVAVVVGLPAVGVLMIAALLITPAAAARFWTERLGRMLALAALFGVAAGVAGALVSANVTVGRERDSLPAGPVIILTASGLFVLSLLLAPRRGVLARWLAQRHFRRQLELGQVAVDAAEAVP
jgi:manganese/zinc/iron transport system permease protein